MNPVLRFGSLAFSLLIVAFCGYKMSQIPLFGWWTLPFLAGFWATIVIAFVHRYNLRWLALSTLSGILLALGFPTSPIIVSIFIGFVPLLMVEREISIIKMNSTALNKRSLPTDRLMKYAFNTFVIWNIGATWWVANAGLVAGMVANYLNAFFMAGVFWFFHRMALTLVQDYWREWFYPLSGDTLQHITPLIGQDPAKLLKTLSEMWKEQERKPREVVTPDITPTQAIDTHMAWQAQVEAAALGAREAWSETTLQALQEAGVQKKIKGLRADYFANWLKALQAWATQSSKAQVSKEEFKVLERFTTQALQDKGWAEAEGFAFFAAMQTYVALFDAKPTTDKHIALHAAYAVGEA